ncbi:S-adenosyl-L-methionine-dependent methyltransferase [Hypoxylon sp. NC1633]|nr:S-adenosyl-L-methionine-dependent methyltransferase [Hypoxylon sp. NC1633]
MTADLSNKASVKSHFEQAASNYEKAVGGTAVRLAATALSLLPLSSYTSSSHILDSACGPGIVTKLLLSPSPYVSVPGLPFSPPLKVTGTDIAPAMIESFMANKASLSWTTADAFVQDSEDLSRFRDGEFDAVVMSLGIFMMNNPGAAATEMLRVLKPGGYAVVTTWRSRRPMELIQGAVAAIRPDGERELWDMAPEWATKEKLQSVMEGGGFARDRIEVTEASPNWECGSGEGIVKTLHSPRWTGKAWEKWSPEEISRWDDEVWKQLRDDERETGILEMTAWVCVARK